MIINHDDGDDDEMNNNHNNRYNDDGGDIGDGNDIGGDNRMEKEKMDLQFVTMIIHKYHRIISIINHILIIIVDKYNIRSRNSIMKMIINETYLPIEKLIFSYQNNCHNDNINATETMTNTNQPAINSSSSSSSTSSTSTTTTTTAASAVMISYSCIQTMVPFLLSITTSRTDDIPFHLAIYHLHCKVITLHQYLTHSYHTYFKGNKINLSNICLLFYQI